MKALLILLVLLVFNALAVVYMLKRRRELLEARDLHVRNRARQDFVVAKQEELQRLVADASRTPEEIRSAADAVLAELLALDTEGVLLPLIRDTDAWVNEQLARRR